MAIIGQWLQNNISIPYPTWQHVVKSMTSSEPCCHLNFTCPTWVETTNQKPRLKNVFVWNCFLIIHLHLTWVFRELVPGFPSEDGPGIQSFWARPPRDTMWLGSGHGPWESQTPKLGSSKTKIPKKPTNMSKLKIWNDVFLFVSISGKLASSTSLGPRVSLKFHFKTS